MSSEAPLQAFLDAHVQVAVLTGHGRWIRSGTNNSAMFAEIVPEQLRSAVYAFDRSFEGAVGATAAPLVGEEFDLFLCAVLRIW